MDNLASYVEKEKTCYNCGNKNCHIFYSAVKQDVAEHHETYEYNVFDCVNHDKWKEMKVEEIRTDNTKTLKNALERIAELEEKISVLLSCKNCPENKGGLICRKEYENKCLAQKIQFIKELQQENAELSAGKPKWHKVAGGDLPSEEDGWVCNQDGLPCYFDWSTEQWLDCEGTQIRTTEWCHTPHKE